MIRKLLCAIFAVTVFTGVLLAEEIKAKFKTWEKGVITVTFDGKDHEFGFARGIRVFNGDEEIKGKRETEKFFASVKKGTDVTLDVDKEKGTTTLVKVKK